MTTSPDTTPSPDNPFAATDVGDSPVGHALDVACGTGMSTIALAELANTVVGLDISPEMMRVAPPRSNVTYMLGAAERLAFTGDSPLEIQFLGTITALRRLP